MERLKLRSALIALVAVGLIYRLDAMFFFVFFSVVSFLFLLEYFSCTFL